jgi:hypothetical protein
MKWIEKPKKEDFKLSWHRKFAWFPTNIEGMTLWLEFYEQISEWIYEYGGEPCIAYRRWTRRQVYGGRKWPD